MALFVKKKTVDHYFAPRRKTQDPVRGPGGGLLSLSNALLLQVATMLLDEAWEEYSDARLFRIPDVHTPVKLSEVYDSKEGMALKVVGALRGSCRRLYKVLSPLLWHQSFVLPFRDLAACGPVQRSSKHHPDRTKVRQAILPAPYHQLFPDLLSPFPNISSVVLWTNDSAPCSHNPVCKSDSFAVGKSLSALHDIVGGSLVSLALYGMAEGVHNLYNRMHPMHLEALPSFCNLTSLTFGCMYNISNCSTFQLAQQAFNDTLAIIASCEKLSRLELSVGSFVWDANAEEDWLPCLTDLTVTKSTDNGRITGYKNEDPLPTYDDEAYDKGHLEDTVNALLHFNADSLQRLTLKGFGTSWLGDVEFELPHLKEASYIGSSWASALVIHEGDFPDSPLRNLLIHDNHLVFYDFSLGGRALDAIDLKTFTELVRRTRRLVKQHEKTLKTLAILVHWPMYSNATAELLQDVKDEFDAMVGGLCSQKGVDCRFEVHP